MTLNEIKSKAALREISMVELASKLKMSRGWMYKKIKNQDIDTLKKIKEILD